MALGSDASEGMDYLERLPRRLVTLYLPLAVFLFVLTVSVLLDDDDDLEAGRRAL